MQSMPCTVCVRKFVCILVRVKYVEVDVLTGLRTAQFAFKCLLLAWLVRCMHNVGNKAIFLPTRISATATASFGCSFAFLFLFIFFVKRSKGEAFLYHQKAISIVIFEFHLPHKTKRKRDLMRTGYSFGQYFQQRSFVCMLITRLPAFDSPQYLTAYSIYYNQYRYEVR